MGTFACIHICTNQEEVELGSIQLVDFCLKHLSTDYFNVLQATHSKYIYGFMGITS